MQPYQQYGGGPPMPPFYGGPPPPGYSGPLQPGAPFQAAPLRLARFPGSELHAPPPGQPGPSQQMQQQMQQQQQQQMYAAQQQQQMQQQMFAGMPPPRQGSAGQRGPPGLSPFQPMLPQPRPVMGPGQAYGVGAPPMPYQQHGQPYGPPHVLAMPPQQGGRSGMATPKAGSGAVTPTHAQMPRTLSGGAQSLALALPPSGFAQQQQQGGYLGGPPLMPPPPGVVLPDSLSPVAPGPLRGGASAPGSRVQSATQLAAHAAAHSRGGSFGGTLMEPLAGSPPRGGLQRAGSAGSVGSMAGSLRGSLDFGSGQPGGGGSLRRTSERAGSGSFAGPRVPSHGSRAGSAGRRGTAGQLAPLPMAPEKLDEYDNIKVAVRVRPPNAQELARGDAQALFVNPADHRQIQLVVPAGYSRNGAPASRNFTFHACLSPASRQQDVLRLCGITQLLDASLDGYNATVLAYGQTGSGKTFTMSGREETLLQEGYLGDSDDGIISRSLAYLFEQLAARSSGPAADGCRYSIRVSFAEIYNEQIYDLIRFDKRQLAVRWDTAKGFHVPELVCKECGSLEETLQVLSLAVRHRRVGSHELNMESSRSHSIFTVYIDATPTRPDDHEFGMTRYGKVSFVDLAGSERLRDSKSTGETMKETTSINRSLFMLGKVIAALADGAQGARVPYRESKLTKLLQDSLGGSSLSLLIACCSPSATHIEETLSTLSYAARAKNIRNQPAVQVDPEQAALTALRREVKLLRTENAYLREQLFQASLPRGQPAGGGVLGAGGSAAASRLPSSHGPPPATPGAGGALPLAGAPTAGAPAAGTGDGASGGTRPASGTAGAGAASGGPAAAGGAAGGAPSPEDLMRRLLETQRMLVQFSRENDRLAGENGRLRSGKTAVANDYKGALEEVDWLRTKLEALEAALLSGTLDKGLLAALDGGLGGAAEVLKAAQAAVAGADGGAGAAAGQVLLAPLRQGSLELSGVLPGMDVVDGSDGGSTLGSAGADAEPEQQRAAAEPAGGNLINDLTPLAGQLAAAAEPATSAATAEAAALAAALAAAEGKHGAAAAAAATAARRSGSSGTASDAAAALAAEHDGELAPALAPAVQALPAKAPLIDRYLVAGPSELGEAVAAPLGSASSSAGGAADTALQAGATATVTVSLSRPASAKAEMAAGAAEEDAALDGAALPG